MVSDKYVNKVYEELSTKLFGDKTQTSIIKLDDEVRELLDVVFPDNLSKVAFTRFANVVSNDLVEQHLMAYLDLKSTGCMFSANSFEAIMHTGYQTHPDIRLDISVNKFTAD